MWLGERITVAVFRAQAKTDKPGPMHLLVHFLKHGNRWQFSKDCARVSMVSRRWIPVLFTLPTSLCEDDSNEQGRRLVLNGTFSIVFRFETAQGLTSLLEASSHFKSFRDIDSWDTFIAEVAEFVARLHGNAGYYLKIVSKDTCLQQAPLYPMIEAWKQLMKSPSILLTYLVKPFGSSHLVSLLCLVAVSH
jgi:hypothetical protein